MKYLSKNFTLEELSASQTATRLGIDNTPNDYHTENLTRLAEQILQPLRDRVGVAVMISSGFRGEELNRRIGGSPNSQHTKGLAADFNVAGMEPGAVVNLIREMDLPFDQLIDEFGRWVHVSISDIGQVRRKQTLLARKDGGKTVYLTA